MPLQVFHALYPSIIIGSDRSADLAAFLVLFSGNRCAEACALQEDRLYLGCLHCP